MMVTMLMTLMTIMKDDNSKNHKVNEQIGDDTFIITIILLILLLIIITYHHHLSKSILLTIHRADFADVRIVTMHPLPSLDDTM